MTSLQAYGFDSYPYLHVARRRCLPYARVLEAVTALERGDDWPAGLDVIDIVEIGRAFEAEQARRCEPKDTP